MLATPLYTGDVCGQFVWSVMQTQVMCLARGVLLDFQWVQNLSLIQCARNYLLHVFMQHPEYTHILWIDGDLGWDPAAVHRMLDKNVDVVGGVYPKKTDDDHEYPYVGESEGTANRLPTGFLLVSRKAVEAVVANVPKHKMPYDGKEHMVPHAFDVVLNEDSNIVSEDYVFCDRLRALGFTLHIESDIDFVHCGRRMWAGNLANKLRPWAWRGLESV